MQNKTILVTGASGGIGRAIVQTLGEAGHSVVAHWGLHEGAAVEATALIPDDRKLLVHADLMDASSIDSMWERAVNWKGSIDVVVNNAATMPEAGIDASDAAWDAAWTQAFEVNVFGAAGVLRRATNHFRETGGGILITLSSWAAQRGSRNPNLIAYAASKAAIAAATKTIANSYAREGVLAYCVAPGPVNTEMTARAALTQGGLDAVRQSLAIGELVDPAEIGSIIGFLATGSARHLTGATLDINGATYIR